MSDVKSEIRALEMDIYQNYEKLQKLRAQLTPEVVENYAFKTSEGESIHLLDMFGDFDELIVVHNMGKSCRYCTAWADGFNAVAPLVSQYVGFYLSSPDVPVVQTEFRESRGWTMPMVSVSENSFAEAMGFRDSDGDYQPGISVFVKNAQGEISRTRTAPLGESDNFGILWHLFDLLAENPIDKAGW
ncbi:DUF899 family protein [Fundicoccus culcitae]|uniref:DUF899 family protein n=1 Tax=Fundicoccus culcitae TaxID=2969821 RepID=A0ABY5P592_9LACT|nr:DUF899 family protein [Fundicoccus culcitae]UUX33876.1 DUF899 family protein [Fundicoccus culcitae]